MYLQRLEDAESSHRNWPADAGDHAALNLWLSIADDTLNSWQEAHILFHTLQGDRPDVRACTMRSFTRLVEKAILASELPRPPVYQTEVVTHALLKIWIAAWQEELKNRAAD